VIVIAVAAGDHTAVKCNEITTRNFVVFSHHICGFFWIYSINAGNGKLSSWGYISDFLLTHKS
jgi:hypothetical protein